MARGVNTQIVMGMLSRDPEVKYTPSGACICTFSIPTEEQWTDKSSGEKQTLTTWHNFVAFGKPAEIIGQHCVKGSYLYVSGTTRHEKWTDNATNTEKTTTKIHVREFQFAGRAGDGSSQQSKPAQQQQSAEFDDDIPF